MAEPRHLSETIDAASLVPSPTNGTPTQGARINTLGIPDGRRGDYFSNFDQERNPEMMAAYGRCISVALGENWCAFLVGDYGTGKTHLAIATLLNFEGYGHFWKVPDFLASLRQDQFDPAVDLEARIWELQTDSPTWAASIEGPLRRLLVFDDLGTENSTDWAAEQLYRVLDGRYDRKLPTVITSNQPRNRLDGRILSRYAEGLIVCKGKDVRRS